MRGSEMRGSEMRCGGIRRSAIIGWALKLACAAWACAVLLAGCSLKPAPLYTTRDFTVEESLPAVGREDLLNEMSVYHGVRYRDGGTSIDGVDCSGLVQAVFGALDVPVPRTVLEQFESGVAVPRRGVKTGDLLFFGPAGRPDHVGIALSGQEILHASPSRGVVVETIDALDRAEGFRGARRLVKLDDNVRVNQR